MVETPCGNGVHGGWFATDSLPLHKFCRESMEQGLGVSLLGMIALLHIQWGEGLMGPSHVGTCGMVLRKALVSSWCWRSGTCRKGWEGSVGCYCRCRHNGRSWSLSRWGWCTPPGDRHLTDISMRSATKQCLIFQKMAFPTGTVSLLASLQRTSQNTSSPGKFAFSHS